LLKELLTLYPEILKSQEKKISYSKIYEFSNIKDIKQYILDLEVEAWFDDGYKKILEDLEEKHNLTIKSFLSDFPSFAEAIARRNLFVHNDGKVNERYLHFCKSAGLETNNILKDQELEVTPEYIGHVLHVFSEFAVILCHQVWRKFIPEENELADADLSDRIVEFIDKRLYIGLKISNYSINLEKYFSEETKLIFIINNALCHKRLKENKEVKKILKSVDWTSANYVLKLCVAILEDNSNEAFILMKRMGAESDLVNADAYRKWPIFEEIKKNKKFRDTFKEIFKEEYYLPQRRVRIHE